MMANQILIVMLYLITGVHTQKISLEPLDIKITPLVVPDKEIRIKLNSEGITTKRLNQEPTSILLESKDVESLHQAILSIPEKEWAGCWASPYILDGFMLRARLERNDAKKLEFGGLNGCPPGFSKILQLVHLNTKEKLSYRLNYGKILRKHRNIMKILRI